jgi:hypothetical protein
VALIGVQFKDILKHFPAEIRAFKNANGIIGRAKVVVNGDMNQMAVNDSAMGNLTFTDVITYSWSDHTKGDCGLPVVAERDQGSCIVGIHSAGQTEDTASAPLSQAYAIAVSRAQISSAVQRVPRVGSVYSERLNVVGGLSNTTESGSVATMPHFKSPSRYEDLGSIINYGKIRDVSIRQKSKLMKTVWHDDLSEVFFDTFGHIRSSVFIPPLMQPVGSGENFLSPYNIVLRKMAKTKVALDMDVVRKVVQLISEQILHNLEDKDIPAMRPLTAKAALNGVLNDPFIRRMNMTRAAGFGTPGKKADYVTRTIVDGETIDTPTAELEQEIVNVIETYLRGESYGPGYKVT